VDRRLGKDPAASVMTSKASTRRGAEGGREGLSEGAAHGARGPAQTTGDEEAGSRGAEESEKARPRITALKACSWSLAGESDGRSTAPSRGEVEAADESRERQQPAAPMAAEPGEGEADLDGDTREGM
jgi:hypothetical protein